MIGLLQPRIRPATVAVLGTVLLVGAGCSSPKPRFTAELPPEQRDPTPSTYRMSAGDEIRIVVYGYPELERTLRIGPEEVLYYPMVGEVPVHDLSIPDLRELLIHGLETAADQRIQTGDELKVTVFRHEELDTVAAVPSSGRIQLPLAGDVPVAGLTVEQANAAIAERLSRYVLKPAVSTSIRQSALPGRILDPQVSVEVLGFGGQKVAVLGEVARPGIYLSDGSTRLTDLLAQAGGTTEAAELRRIVLVRPASGETEEVAATINLTEMIRDGNLDHDYPIQRGDVIYVPTTSIANAGNFMQQVFWTIRPFTEILRGVWLGQNISYGPNRPVAVAN